jgi:DNA helicase-2/ATP-dependent DNA helicase PcrA
MRMRPEQWRPVGVDELEPAADEAVRSERSTLLVAGPGAGKTELLAQRACYLLQTGICQDPHRVLAISFKRDAARNLKERVTLRCGEALARRFDSYTFDSFAKGLIDRLVCGIPKHFRPSADYEFTDLTERNIRDQVLSLPTGQCRLSAGRRQALGAQALWEAFIGRELPTSGQWDNDTDEDVAAEDLWRFMLKGGSKSHVIFPMVGRIAELLLRTNPSILGALRSTYTYVFLDEFQDTTRIQYALIRRAFRGSDAELTAVGDKKQRIMGWAGAMQKAFDAFAKDFDAPTLPLSRNYRSSGELVRIQSVVARALDSNAVAAVSMVQGDEVGECRILTFPDDDAEASQLARMIREWLHAGALRARDICVLCRMKAPTYSQKLQAALAANGIRSRVENELQDLLAEPLCEVLLDMLKLAARQTAPEAWGRVLSLLASLDVGESDLALQHRVDALLRYLADLRKILEGGSWTEESVLSVLRAAMSFVGEDAYKAAHPQYLQGDWYDRQLRLLAQNLAEARQGRSWSDAIDEVEGVDCVPIMTMHKSKGLEYHTVIFVGLEDDALWNYSRNQVEETCGFFVGLSRAKRRIIFTYSGVRPTGKFGKQASQSRTRIAALYDLLAAAGVVVEEHTP